MPFQLKLQTQFFFGVFFVGVEDGIRTELFYGYSNLIDLDRV